jgi:SAM-dependent methyltransferase
MIQPSPSTGIPSDKIQSQNRDLEDIINVLKIPKGSKILDINCGTGERTQFLEDLGFKVMGIDENPVKIREGRLLYPELEIYQHDMQDIFYVHYFDWVMVMDIEEVFHRKSAENEYILKNLLACLAPHGKVVIGFSPKDGSLSMMEKLFKEAQGENLQIKNLDLSSKNQKPHSEVVYREYKSIQIIRTAHS